jgi:uncharacterized protein YbbC (DUF1343 family)
MVETADETDPRLGIPVFSLYGQVRRPTGQMMSTADVFLFDLQDLGCRIYTFVTTLLYLLEAAAEAGKEVWVLDRPNPAGRPVEGSLLEPGYESFVGAGPMPMRHGLTMGEMGHWFIRHFNLDVAYKVVEMQGWQPEEAPGFGWPTDRIWINPSPNAATLNMARAYAGTVMLEGTTLSEGRGTTRALELFASPGLDARAIHAEMERLAPHWLQGVQAARDLRRADLPQHAGKLCSGLFIHAEGPGTTTRPSSPGASRPSRSRRSATLHPTTSCGAISRMNMSSTSSPSTSSTAGRACANGWTTTPPKPATSMPAPPPTKHRGTSK